MIIRLKKRIVALRQIPSEIEDPTDLFNRLHLSASPSSPGSDFSNTNNRIEPLDLEDGFSVLRRLFSDETSRIYPGDLIAPTLGQIDPFKNSKLVRNQPVTVELYKRTGEDRERFIRMVGVTGAIQYKTDSDGKHRWSKVIGGGCFLGKNIFVTDHHCVSENNQFRVTFTDYSKFPSESYRYNATRADQKLFNKLAFSLSILFRPASDINLLILEGKTDNQFPSYYPTIQTQEKKPTSLTHFGFKGGVMHVSISSERLVLATDLVKREWSLEGLAVCWSQMKTRGVVTQATVEEGLQALSIDSKGQKGHTVEVTPERSTKLYKTSSRTSEIDLKVRLPMIFWPDCSVVAHKTGPGSSGGTYWDESLGLKSGFYGLHLGKLPEWLFPTDAENHFENHLVAHIGVSPEAVFKLLPYLRLETITKPKTDWEKSVLGLGELPSYNVNDDRKYLVCVQEPVLKKAGKDLFGFLFEKLTELSQNSFEKFEGDQTVSGEVVSRARLNRFEFQELAVTVARFYKNEIRDVFTFLENQGRDKLDGKTVTYQREQWTLSRDGQSDTTHRKAFVMHSGTKTQSLTVSNSGRIRIGNELIDGGSLYIKITKTKFVMVVSANTSPKGELVQTGDKRQNTRHAEALSLAQIFSIKEEGWLIDSVVVTHGQINTECVACAEHINQFELWRNTWNCDPK